MKNLDYRNLCALDAVIHHGNFEKAALVLAISQSAVSQRIKALEDSCGRLLVVRGQPAMATELGRRLITHFQHVKLLENALGSELGQAPHIPTIAVAADADSLATWFGAATQDVLASGICRLDLRLAGLDAAMRALRDGSVFGCVSSSSDTVGGASMTALGRMRHVLVASPAFAAKWFGEGVTPQAVQAAPAAACNPALHAHYLAQRFGLGGECPHHTLATPYSQLACLGAGWAYGLLPLLLAQAELASGRLLDLTPGDGADIALHWHAWSVHTPATRLLSEQVVQGARRSLAALEHVMAN